MNRKSIRRVVAGALAAALATLAPSTASAAVQTFNFIIPDFTFAPGSPGIGTLLGYFSGSDTDGDGALVQNVAAINELTDFGATFFLNDGTPVLDFTFADMQASNGGLIYNYSGMLASDTGPFGPGGFYVDDGTFFASGGEAADFPCDGDVCAAGGYLTGGQVVVSVSPGFVVAAPGAPAPLLGLGLLPAIAGAGGLAAVRRRKRTALA